MKYIAVLLLLVTSVASAALVTEIGGLTLPQVQGLNTEANTLVAEVPGLSSSIDATITTDVNIKKEAKVYTDDQKQKLAMIAAAEAQVTETVLAPQKRPYDTDLANYTAQCQRTFNRETEMDAYNRCMNWKSNIDTRKAQLESWWTSYTVQWNAQNVDPINAVIVKQNARLAVLQAQSESNTQRYNAAMERMKLVRARVEQITGIVNGFCHQAAQTPEALSWCNSVDWDGASKKLQAMPTNGYGTGGASQN